MDKFQLIFNKLPIIIINKISLVVKTLFRDNYMFTEVVENNHTPNITTLLLAISLIGGIIVMTLAYVSWRKYSAEQKKKREQNKSKH